MSGLVLSIDTSCDDTSAAVVCGREIWSNVIASQTDLHRPYGGVFPTVAKQAHKENIEPTVKMALKRAGVAIDQINKIAVTIGPGLAPALEVGIDYAKQLAEQHQLPLIPVNHIEGHVLSVLAKPRSKSNRQPGSFTRHPELVSGSTVECRHSGFNPESQNLIDQRLPALSIIVSGKHTEFVLVEPPKARHAELISLDRQPRLSLAPDPLDPDRPWLNSGHFTYTILGQTLDDAAGECLDKVGRMLNLGYPAAPVMEQLAKLGDPSQYPFPLPMTTSHDYHLSFAGLKTHARRLIESEFGNQPPTKQQTYDFCASFQTAVFRHITYKLSKVLQDYPQIQEVWLGGGVAANVALRKSIRQTLKQFSRSLRVPYTKRLCQDNAGMGGVTVNQLRQW